MLWRRPGFTLLAVFLLALGIGTGAATITKKPDHGLAQSQSARGPDDPKELAGFLNRFFVEQIRYWRRVPKPIGSGGKLAKG